jgi:twinkle protein
MITPSYIADRLAEQAQGVAEYILGHGSRNGRELLYGDISGSQGQSLKVCVEGTKRGVWSDFATGEAGDMLDLWREARRLSMSDTINEAKKYLSIKDDEPQRKIKKQKQYTRPQKPNSIKKATKVAEYLKSRGISQEAIRAYKIAENGNEIVFPYRKNDELYGIKYVGIERDAKGKKKTRVEENCEPTLFGWDVVSDKAREIVICEGEIDAMSFYTYGITALSVPFGAGGGEKQSWIDTDYHDLERFDTIYICMDMDDEGEKAANEISQRLGTYRCRIVSLPKNDVNECLQSGVPEDFINACLEEATTRDPEELKSIVEYSDDIIEAFYPSSGQQPGFSLPWDKTNNIRVHHGELSLWTGFSGHGKSVFLGQVMNHAIKAGEKVCVASFEMQPKSTFKRMIQQEVESSLPSRETIKNVVASHSENLFAFALVGSGKTDRVIDVFEYAFRRYGVRQFVVDSLMKLGLAEDDYSGQKIAVERLSDFCNEFSVSIHLVTHSRKKENESTPPGKMDIKGSGGMTDLADNVFCVFRNKAKEAEARAYIEQNGYESSGVMSDEISAKYDALFACNKCRENGENEGVWGLYFNRKTLVYSDERL